MSNPSGNGSNGRNGNGRPPNGGDRKKQIRQNLVDDSLADDLLIGADEIAEYIYGDRTLRRKIYDHRKLGRMPLFGMSAQICARKSTLRAWFEEQEKRGPRAGLHPAAGPVVRPKFPGGSMAAHGTGRNSEEPGPGRPS